ncbi:acetylcholine receptor subunit gamma-like [Haliotis rufescens]|uniref:acetylcholine receptor subunit gamma-like n=1 Tax=Haliotis rufescens TaxID=6454 RepID=UPI001EB00A93|nr:acetylcholine receptor subunit gamma-like [Haliotis rufescens]
MDFVKVTLLGLLHFSVSDGASYIDLQRLHNNLLNDYQPNLRPVNDSAQTVFVNTDIAVSKIVTLDATREILVTWLDLVVTWTDERLTWDDKKYTDVRTINFPRSKIWVPELQVLKTHSGKDTFGEADNAIQVFPDGKVEWYIDLETRTPCPMRLTKFPFDIHTCSITMTTSYHRELDVNVSDVTFTAEDVIDTGEWAMTRASAKRVTLRERGPKGGVSMTLILQRRQGYYIFSLIMPLFIVTFVNPCVILVKSNSGEKTSTSVTLFLSFTIFITLLTDLLPQSSKDIPILTIIVYTLFVFSSSIVAYCIVSQRLSQREKHSRLTRIFASVLLKKCKKKVVQPATPPDAGDDSKEEDLEEFTDFPLLADKLDKVVFVICVFYTSLVMIGALLSLLLK